MISDIDVIIRLIMAAILGGLIGFERESHGRAAGLRTHILVCLGSTLIMLTSMHVFELYKGVAEVDPGRIAAQVVTGVGFLGAGTIMRFRASVKGLTTAASLWVVAGIGLAIGSGMFSAAVSTTALVLIALFFFSKVQKVWTNKDWYKTLAISTEGTAEELRYIKDVLSKYGAEIRDFEIEKREGKSTVLLNVKLLTNREDDKIIFDIMKLDGVERAGWE